MIFLEKFKRSVERSGSLLCIGLDTIPGEIPPHLKFENNPVLSFNCAIIEATADVVSAYKINSAFYEALGAEGFETLKRTIEFIPKDIPVILDVKRSDIETSSAMYAKSAFEYFNADALTVNPYFGVDSIKPFLSYEGKFIFVIILSSNAGAMDFQYVRCEAGKFFFQVVAEKFVALGLKNIGFVVGATRGADIRKVREMSDEILFLIPGIGAQGGDIESSVVYGLNREKLAIINVSRSVIYASSGKDFQEKVRERVIEFKNKINEIAGRL